MKKISVIVPVYNGVKFIKKMFGLFNQSNIPKCRDNIIR